MKWYSDPLETYKIWVKKEIMNKSINGLIEVPMLKKSLKYHAICIQDLKLNISNISHNNCAGCKLICFKAGPYEHT